MSKIDLVILKKDIKINSEDVLKKDTLGVILKMERENLKVVFFNPKNIGDYLITDINTNDVILEGTEMPEKYENEILGILKDLKVSKKDEFKKSTIKNYDKVELLVEKERYVKYGVHKGCVGVVVDDNAVKDYIEVDFSYVDENGNFFGESFAVKLEDLKVVE